MHNCDFCNTQYAPRPQVKNPKACTGCQEKRQRANEKAWKNANPGLYDGKYHRRLREVRKKEMKARIQQLVRFIDVGSTFLGTTFLSKSQVEFMNWLFQALWAAGTRRANQLWCLGIANPIGPL